MQLKKYSGKFMLRVLPEKHRMLAIQAAEQGASKAEICRSFTIKRSSLYDALGRIITKV